MRGLELLATSVRGLKLLATSEDRREQRACGLKLLAAKRDVGSELSAVHVLLVYEAFYCVRSTSTDACRSGQLACKHQISAISRSEMGIRQCT